MLSAFQNLKHGYAGVKGGDANGITSEEGSNLTNEDHDFYGLLDLPGDVGEENQERGIVNGQLMVSRFVSHLLSRSAPISQITQSRHGRHV